MISFVYLSSLVSLSTRLHLPKEVEESGKESASWQADKQRFLVRLPKKNRGENFEGLDMLTKLLTAPRQKAACTAKAGAPLIEVVENSGNSNDTDVEAIQEQEEEFDWHLEQIVREQAADDELSLLSEKYGFASSKSGLFGSLGEEIALVVDLQQPDKKSWSQRRQERTEAELEQFDEDHYLADLYEQKEVIDEIINYKAFWESGKEEEPQAIKFNQDEQYRLKNLPRKEYLLDSKEKQSLLLGMVDILFAYAYDLRTSEGDQSVESSWTIRKLSATLSWLDEFSSLKEVSTAAVRRSLCFPLYRNWALSIKVLKDTHNIIELGRAAVLKCFLDIHRLLNEEGDLHYFLNDLYITDYCVWLQSVKESTFKKLAEALRQQQITKADIDLELDLLERAACSALDDEKQEIEACNVDEQLNDNLSSMNLSGNS